MSVAAVHPRVRTTEADDGGQVARSPGGRATGAAG